MTAQIPETLVHRGEALSMCTEPLGDYFALAGIESPFVSESSALWRGYLGRWEIVDDRLYLVRLEGALKGGRAADLGTLFPGYPERVFAHWYGGTLRIPRGRRIEYVHMGYGSTFEQDLLLDVERGMVVASRVRENGVAPEGAPEGYGVAAMTIRRRPRGPSTGGGRE